VRVGVKLKDSYTIVHPQSFVLQSITIVLFYVRITGADSDRIDLHREIRFKLSRSFYCLGAY